MAYAASAALAGAGYASQRLVSRFLTEPGLLAAGTPKLMIAVAVLAAVTAATTSTTDTAIIV